MNLEHKEAETINAEWFIFDLSSWFQPYPKLVLSLEFAVMFIN